jgi:hypothetical protein
LRDREKKERALTHSLKAPSREREREREKERGQDPTLHRPPLPTSGQKNVPCIQVAACDYMHFFDFKVRCEGMRLRQREESPGQQ